MALVSLSRVLSPSKSSVEEVDASRGTAAGADGFDAGVFAGLFVTGGAAFPFVVGAGGLATGAGAGCGFSAVSSTDAVPGCDAFVSAAVVSGAFVSGAVFSGA